MSHLPRVHSQAGPPPTHLTSPSCFTGSLAIPAPSIMLVPPHPSSQEDPIHILCMAPRGFPGANFTLYQGGEVVELLKAPKDQLRVIFNLSGGSREAQGGPFCCQYSVLGENRQPQLSNLSEPVHVSFPGKSLLSALTAQAPSSHGQAVVGTLLSTGESSLFQLARTFFSLFNPQSPICHGEGNGNPLQYSCLENPVDGGAW